MTDTTNADAGVFTLTTPVTMTFPNLLEARAVENKGKPSGEPKYSGNFEFAADHADLQALKAAAMAVARAKWPGRNVGMEAAYFDANKNPKLPTFLFPFTSGDKLADKAKAKNKDREFSRGKAVLTARSKFQPRLSILANGKVVDLEGDAIKANGRQFYSGCLVLAQFNFVAYDGVGESGADGVTAYLNMVVSLNKGTKLSGGASAAEVFKGYVGLASAEDPTGGMGASDLDDEIPF